jgi:hypothetical protein
MKHLLTRLALVLCIALPCQAALALGTPGTPAEFGPKAQADNPCLTEVSKFEQVIAFIRQSQGKEAAATVKEKLLPAKLESEILFKEGYCGLAKNLRERKLID